MFAALALLLEPPGVLLALLADIPDGESVDELAEEFPCAGLLPFELSCNTWPPAAPEDPNKLSLSELLLELLESLVYALSLNADGKG